MGNANALATALQMATIYVDSVQLASLHGRTTLNKAMTAPNDPVKDEIRRFGLRATPARLATLLLLRESTSPLTHAEVSEQLADRGIDRATAFRNLNDLAEVGLLRRTELGDHVWRFEAVRGEPQDDTGHPHFLCIDCGTVSCLDDVKLTAGSLRQSAKIGEITEILLRGHCNGCADTSTTRR